MALSIPYTFVAGTAAVAAEVNSNFLAIASWANNPNIGTDSLGILQARTVSLPSAPTNAILYLNQTSSNPALYILNAGTDCSLEIVQSSQLATGKGVIKITDNFTQTISGANEFVMNLAANSTIPALLIKHDATETFKVTKDSLNLFSDSTKISADRIKLPVRTTVERDAVTEEGSILYNTTEKVIQYRTNTEWRDFTPTGIIQMFGGSAAPPGWLLCDGSIVSQTTYAYLFAVISTAFNTGGEGAGDFRLPDFRRRAAIGSGGTGTATLGNAVGNSGGAETVTLSTANLPSAATTGSAGSHFHSIYAGGQPGGAEVTMRLSTNNTGGVNASSPSYLSGSTDPSHKPVNQLTNTTGSHTHTISGATDTPVNIIQPSLVVNYIIKY